MAALLPVVSALLPAVVDMGAGFAAGAAPRPFEGRADAAASPAANLDPGGFTQTLSRAAHDAARALGEAESVSLQAMHGSASLQDVATKVMAAERAVQTAIALRDRFVGALQEISRMQV